jgi:hypothetical protein
MHHNNLVLSEQAIKRHCKRLQKEMTSYNQNLSLGEIQNLFAKTLGFNNFHDLKSVITPTTVSSNSIEEELKKYESIIEQKNYAWIYIHTIDNILEHNFQKMITETISSVNKLDTVVVEKTLISTNKIMVFIDLEKSIFISKPNIGKFGITLHGILHSISHKLCNHISEFQEHNLFNELMYSYCFTNDKHLDLVVVDLLDRKEQLI